MTAHYSKIDVTLKPRGWRGDQTVRVADANAELEAEKANNPGHTVTIPMIARRHGLKPHQLQQFRSYLRRRKTPVPE